jgi:hypothetical protein
MMLFFRFAAIALSAALVVSCARKPREEWPLASDPEGLQTRISRVRHSDPSRAAKLAEQAYRRLEAGISPIWQWRFRLLHAELLLDQAGGSKAPIPTVLELLNSPTPPGVSSVEASARIASIRGYVAQVQSQWQVAERFYEEASG